MKYRIIFYTFEFEGVNACLDKSEVKSRYACRNICMKMDGIIAMENGDIR